MFPKAQYNHILKISHRILWFAHLSIGIMKVHCKLLRRNGFKHFVQQLMRGARRPSADGVTQRYLVAAHVQQTLGYIGHLQVDVCALYCLVST